MGSESGRQVYDDVGVKPVINAAGGHLTKLGGSILSPQVERAMAAANRYFVDMEDLLAKTGQIAADLLRAEAAYITPGCCAALALGTAACMAGSDPDKIVRLPDTTGMKNQVIIQKAGRYKYDRCVTVPGAKLVEVGDASGATAEQIEAAIGEKTVAIEYLAPPRSEGQVPLEDVIRIGKRHDVPVIVDAAAHVYPVEEMTQYAAMGADLVCYGAKYFGAPNSSGVLAGRKDLVEAASRHGFVAFETTPYPTFGRPFKLDRQEIIAVVVALREWVAMDHQARFESYARRVKRLQDALKGIDGIVTTPQGSPANALRVELDEAVVGATTAQVAQRLLEANPSILVRVRDGALVCTLTTIVDGDEPVIAEGLKRALVG